MAHELASLGGYHLLWPRGGHQFIGGGLKILPKIFFDLVTWSTMEISNCIFSYAHFFLYYIGGSWFHFYVFTL